MPSVIDNTPRARRTLQTICDAARKPLAECRIVDLGCAHGQYTLELARRGATALGIEGRAAWIDRANESKRSLGLSNATFVQDDARNLSPEKYGTFDIVICSGLLYHLNSPDIFELMQAMYDTCTDFTLIDTEIALHPVAQTSWRGRTYHGLRYQEHAPESDRATRTASLGASLEEEQSFWLTLPSLLNALQHVGFTSVVQMRNPLDNLYVNGTFRMHQSFVGLLAFKGRPIGEFVGMGEKTEFEDWPEDERPFHWSPGIPKVHEQSAWRRRMTRPSSLFSGIIKRAKALRPGRE